MRKVTIGITMGDPSGCGPEITLKALRSPEIYQKCRPVVIGDANVMRAAKGILKLSEMKINAVQSPDEGIYMPGTVDVLDLRLIDDPGGPEYGKISAISGNAAYKSVEKAIKLAVSGEIDAVVTNAINKEAINLANRYYAGHTEIFSTLTNTPKSAMLLTNKNLRVVFVSDNVSMREAYQQIRSDRIFDTITIAFNACMDFGIAEPRIGVAGFNPHCGGDGLFGREEADEIIPAIERAREKDMDVDGPISADTVFSRGYDNKYDICVAMYHDQGHIPLKLKCPMLYPDNGQTQGISEGVNITLGLPIIRTSVDHGTEFAFAGTGTTSERSLVNAIDYAVTMAVVARDRKITG